MFATILALLAPILPTVAGWVNLVIGWFQTQSQEQAAAAAAEAKAESEHQDDGSISVAEKTSADAQNAGLDQLDNQHDNPKT